MTGLQSEGKGLQWHNYSNSKQSFLEFSNFQLIRGMSQFANEVKIIMGTVQKWKKVNGCVISEDEDQAAKLQMKG